MNSQTKLKVGELVLIPVKSAAPLDYSSPNISQSEDFETLEWVNGEYWYVTRHPVKPKETFYSLSRFYELPLEKLKSLNPGLAQPQVGGSVAVGKVRLAVPKDETPEPIELRKPEPEKKAKPDFTASAPLPVPIPLHSPPAPINPNDYAEAFRQWGKDGLKPSRFRGKCIIDNQNLSSHEAASDVAPVGSLIQIRNLLSQQSILLKVKSALTTEEKKKEIVVRIPQSTLQQLGATKESVLLVETLFYQSQ